MNTTQPTPEQMERVRKAAAAVHPYRQYQEGRKDGPEPGSADWLKQSPNYHPGDLA